VGAVAYRLDLPATTSIHPVFHVSQLKQAIGVGCSVSPALPAALESWQVPEKILQRRIVSQEAQILVKWSSLPEELATWENLESPSSFSSRSCLGSCRFARRGGCQHRW